MKIKKHFILIFFLLFCIFISNVHAKRGELRYEITDFSLNGSEITFKGWAFIHQTNNYVKVKKLEYDNASVKGLAKETSEILKDDGGQEIKIRAIDKNTRKVIEEKEVLGSDEVNYNFYREMFYSFSDFYKTTENLVDCYNGTSSYGCDNKCTENDPYSQCYYKDLYFSITFDVSKWDIDKDTDVYFEISVRNNDYGDWVSEKLFLVNGVAQSKLSNDNIEIASSAFSNIVKFIGVTAQLFNINNGNAAESGIYGNRGSNYLVNSYKGGEDSKFLSSSKNPGKYNLYISKKGKGNCIYGNNRCWLSTCNGLNCYESETILGAYGSWVKPTGETEFTIKVKNDKKCPITNPTEGEESLTCNSSKTLNSTCDELTVNTSNGRANVKIEQTGTISSILTPESTYSGGGFKFGIIYYNELKWSYVSNPNNIDLTNTMQNKIIKDIIPFTNDLKLSEIKFGDTTIDSNFIIKKCIESGTFTNGDTLTTVCTFFLPASEISKNGEVNYLEDKSLAQVNNKYYTPLNYQGNYSITAKITGMSRITDTSAKNDSEEENRPWTGTWGDSFNNCTINLYPLLTENTTPESNTIYNSKLRFNFIYRPIDLNNPFPNRNAGINWYDWIQNKSNQERLKETYSKLQYQVKLDNKTTYAIKDYNSEHNYLDWDGIDKNEESSFINDYFTIYRKNIEGDNP